MTQKQLQSSLLACSKQARDNDDARRREARQSATTATAGCGRCRQLFDAAHNERGLSRVAAGTARVARRAAGLRDLALEEQQNADVYAATEREATEALETATRDAERLSAHADWLESI